MGALLPIDMVVRELCLEANDPTFKAYNTFLRSVVRAYRDLNLYAMPTVKSCILTPNSAGAADLPEDLIKIFKVGLIRNGRIVTISIDDSMAFRNCFNMEEVEKDIDCICSGEVTGLQNTPFYNVHQGGNVIGEQYGLGGGYRAIGFYRYDKSQNQLQFSSSIRKQDKIIVEYKADGTSQGLELIPSEVEIAIRSFANWEYYRVKSPQLSDRSRQVYIQEHTRVKKLYNDMNMEDWMDVLTGNYKLSPK